MKCELIRPARAINPDFSPKEKRLAKAEGRVYDVPPIIERPVGHIQEHPDCWQHCVKGFMNSDPIAIPADDECRERVRHWLSERPRRLRILAGVLADHKPSSKKAREFYGELRKAYEVELHEIDPEKFPIGENDDTEFYEEDEDD